MVGMFYTYVLRSKKDGNLYIGWTNDLDNRIKMHNRGLVEATKYRTPKGAVAREKQLKTGFGRAYLKRRLT